MNSYSSVTRDRAKKPAFAFTLAATAVVVSIGIAASAAQNKSVVVAAPAASEVLPSELDERDARIAALEEQLAFARQAALLSESRVDDQREAFEAAEQLAFQSGDDAIERWRLGYAMGGGQNLSAFETIILPCESGGEEDPDAAIGRTDDWGRAQINRPTWSVRFTELTGLGFEEWIRDPIVNGYMAATVEAEHGRGLNAWTCWRRR